MILTLIFKVMGEPKMANAVDVARYLIKLAGDEGETLTNMQLQKLVYIAHGLHLATEGVPLLDEVVNAWKHGPVIPDVYYAFSKYGNERVSASEGGSCEALTPWACESIKNAYENFGKFNGWTLRNVTHKEGSPWDKVWNKGGGKARQNAVIPNEVIQKHYENIVATGKAVVL